MKLATAPVGGVDFDPAPAGTHRAVCTKFIDLGSHENNYQGKISMKREIALGFELTDELTTFGDDEAEKPYMVMRWFTWTMADKGYLRPFLENWRGKPFTADELQNFDVKALLGAGCTLTVQHKDNAKGVKKANITSIGSLMKGTAKPQAAGELIYVALEPGLFDEKQFDGLTDWFKDKIRSSQEWLSIDGDGEVPTKQVDDDIDDEIPF